MSQIFSGRFTAPNIEPIVVFRIGMRFNGWRGIVPALRTFAAMPGMLAEQSSDPSIGMLGLSSAVSWPVITITQFWRSFDDLERYAAAPEGRHARVWRWFNRLGRSGVGTGIWHETYQVDAGAYEGIYVNMPRYGLAAATGHTAVTPATSRARARIQRATKPAQGLQAVSQQHANDAVAAARECAGDTTAAAQ